MAFSISFSPKEYDFERWYQSCQQNPYDHWLSQGKPYGTVFMYSDHTLDDVMRIVYIPYHNLIHIDMDLEYYSMVATLAVVVFQEDKQIKIVQVSCSNKNHWPTVLGPDAPVTQDGGVEVFRENLDFLAGAEILKKTATEMFGADWSFQDLTCVDKVAKGQESFAAQCFADIEYNRGPWGKTIGTYDQKSYEKAAMCIQAFYRGWKTRLQLRYNPENRLGYHVVSRMFTK